MIDAHVSIRLQHQAIPDSDSRTCALYCILELVPASTKCTLDWNVNGLQFHRPWIMCKLKDQRMVVRVQSQTDSGGKLLVIELHRSTTPLGCCSASSETEERTAGIDSEWANGEGVVLVSGHCMLVNRHRSAADRLGLQTFSHLSSTS